MKEKIDILYFPASHSVGKYLWDEMFRVIKDLNQNGSSLKMFTDSLLCKEVWYVNYMESFEVQPFIIAKTHRTGEIGSGL